MTRSLIYCHILTLITFLSASLHRIQSARQLFKAIIYFLLLEKCSVESADTLWMSKLLRGSDVRQRRADHAGNLDSTRPKDKPARHIKPAALIIQSGDGCLWQINVFYDSTLALHCNFSCREEKKEKKNGARSSINMHFIPTNGQKKQKNKCTSLKTEWQQMQRAVREGARERERGIGKAVLAFICEWYTAARQPCKHPGEFHSCSGIRKD